MFALVLTEQWKCWERCSLAAVQTPEMYQRNCSLTEIPPHQSDDGSIASHAERLEGSADRMTALATIGPLMVDFQRLLEVF